MATLERVKQVRVSRAMDERLQEDAKSLGMREAEAIRLGLELLHDRARRQRGIDWLVEMAYVPHDPDERVRLR